MANIKIPRKTFEREIGKLDEKMQERISMFGTPLESFNEDEIKIEIFPNRPDLLSYSGFKRSFLGFIGKKTGIKEYKIQKPEKDYFVNIDSSVKEIRPFTACAIIKDLELNDEKIKEIIDIQEKLHFTIGRKREKLAIGIYPLEKINLPITYKALEPDKIRFIPLESEREMSGLEILQRHVKGKEYAHLLAGKVKFPIFIDKENKILSMPPIINSELTGKITEKTKDIFIECSGFDFEICKRCINILSTLFAEMGGKIYQMELKYSKKEVTPNLTTEKMKISSENIEKVLGIKTNEKEIKTNLEKMGHNYNKGLVEIPSWRFDILHEIDLIEDFAIAYGYEKLIPELPEISTIGQEDRTEIIKRKISEILTGLNFLEVINYHLSTKSEEFENMGFSEKEQRGIIEVLESKTEYNILRKSLSSSLLRVFSKNVDSEYPQRIFEIGRVFEMNKENIEEKNKLSIGISSGNYTDLKQILEYLGRMINLKLEIKEPKEETPHYLIEGRTAEITLNEKTLGFFGEVHPKILKNWKIKMPVSLLEIDLEEIFKEIN